MGTHWKKIMVGLTIVVDLIKGTRDCRLHDFKFQTGFGWGFLGCCRERLVN